MNGWRQTRAAVVVQRPSSHCARMSKTKLTLHYSTCLLRFPSARARLLDHVCLPFYVLTSDPLGCAPFPEIHSFLPACRKKKKNRAQKWCAKNGPQHMQEPPCFRAEETQAKSVWFWPLGWREACMRPWDGCVKAGLILPSCGGNGSLLSHLPRRSPLCGSRFRR